MMSIAPNVEAWLRDQATTTGLTLTSAIETVKQTPTATILRVQSDQGALFFKSTMPAFAFEAGVTVALARWFPESLPRVVTVDEQRGWLLMHDAGISLRQLMGDALDLDLWIAMLHYYADLQQDITDRAPSLLPLGLPDRRLGQLPTLFQALLAADDLPAVVLLDQPDGLTAAQLDDLRASTDHLVNLCTELAAFSIPETLHHDDFNVNNITLDGDQLVFIDWGESALAHPFYSLMLSLRYAKLVFHADDAQIVRLRDVYLQRWTTYAPLPDLHRAFTLAAQLAALCRALTWLQVVRGLSPDDRAEYADAVPYWLLTFLRNSPLEA